MTKPGGCIGALVRVKARVRARALDGRRGTSDRRLAALGERLHGVDVVAIIAAMRTTKQKVRNTALAGLILGALLFWSGQPSRLPEDQIAAAKLALQEWQVKQTEDVTHGRPSTAGPAPKVETHTPASLGLTVLGFLFCAVSIVALIQSSM